ncbi:hypothetical protein BGX31_002987 [Mortierella sp. GBA43]|nr:hypothetical protein BGX31_002987 [Mortierella sp. GBA43]
MNDHYLFAGCKDGSLHKWQYIEEEGKQCRVRLCWSGTNGVLIVTGVRIQDASGLTLLNKQLLKQRGAVGEPAPLLREAGKMVMSMAAVVSRLKQSHPVEMEPESPLILSPTDKGREAQDPIYTSKSTGRPSSITQPITSSYRVSRRHHSAYFSGTKVQQARGIATLPTFIFAENLSPPSNNLKLPEPGERLTNTLQLVCCLGLLQVSHSSERILDPTAHKWLRGIEKDTEEQKRLHALSIAVIRAFKRDEIKDAKAIAEVVCLAPVINKGSFRDLLREFYSGIENCSLLNFHLLEGLAQLMQGAGPGYLDSDDLVRILKLLSTRLMDTHQQSSRHMHQLTLAVSHVLDAMADTKVTDLDRKKLHEPLMLYLNILEASSDPYLVYQAAYAYQALLCVPDNETTWQAAMRRTGKVIQGVSGLVSAVKGLDLIKFIEGLEDIQKGVAGVSKVAEVLKTTYNDVSSLPNGGKQFLNCLKEGLSFKRKRDWYSALRGADALIRDGEFATFKNLTCEAPCRHDAAFQWGICQRLGEVAADPTWDAVTRRSAIAFLSEIYRNDEVWGQQPSVKQWILNILMQLASSGDTLQLHATVAETQLQELETCEDTKKQAPYRACQKEGPIAYPLKISLPELASPSLLDRVQN